MSKLQSSECSRAKGSQRDAIRGFTWALTPSVPRIVGQRIRTPPGRKRRVRKVQGLSRRRVYSKPGGRRPKSARWYELLRNARDGRPTLARDDRSGSRGRSECELRVGCGNAAQGIEIPDSRSLRDEVCVCVCHARETGLPELGARERRPGGHVDAFRFRRTREASRPFRQAGCRSPGGAARSAAHVAYA